jgi:hypothetical protein
MKKLLLIGLLLFVAILFISFSGITQNEDSSNSLQEENFYACEDDLIEVMFLESSQVRLRNGQLTDLKSDATAGLNDLLSKFEWHQWFRFCSVDESEIDQWSINGERNTGKPVYNLNNIYRLRIPKGYNVWELCRQLKDLPGIYLAIPVPKPVPAPSSAPPPGSFQSQQGYLNSAASTPTGVDATWAWTQTGGTGTGVTICDLEYSWNYSHADVTKALNSQINPNPVADPFNDDNHGTAVIGQLVSDNNGWGTTGISYGSGLKTCGTYYWEFGSYGWNPAGAIGYAINNLGAGDIILLEQQWEYTPGTGNFIPLEWYGSTSNGPYPNQYNNSVYVAITNAISNGIHVVEAGGNGNVNTDNLTWYGNSGAIIVGAGGAYSGGTWSEGDLQRLSYSSYGQRFDLQGWGEDVVTTGYGNLYSAEGKNYWYTNTFSGTSSASPIVAGAVACVQGYYLANITTTPFSPSAMRSHLITYGTAQIIPPSGHIGPRPDIKNAIQNLPQLPDEYDFGDAPDMPYPTLLSNSGARHKLDGITYLGISVDPENDGQPNVTATGDDNDGSNDDDGVVFTSLLIPGQTATVQVIASVAGFLNAWIDFNQLSVWSDPGEFIFQNVTLNAGVNNLSFFVPFNAIVGNTFARFRFSSTGGLLFYGAAPDGEVEDYMVYIGDDIPPDGYDWGDAPDPNYPTLAVNNGARHQFLNGYFLGNSIDTEPDGQPDPQALGDDNNGIDDEDGVVFNLPIIPGNSANITVTASAPGILNAWIDLNFNGSWGDPGEHIFVDLPIAMGPNLLVFPMPLFVPTGNTFARFRFSSVTGLSYTGQAPDGEVEDYMVFIGEDIPPEGYDWGDAPDGPYPTLAINNGANHMIMPGFCLGSSVDPEPDGQPDPNATGDDNDGNNDDDGVIFTSQIIAGQMATVDVIASSPGILNAWIDFDNNGTWMDPGEHIFMDVALATGINNLTYMVPSTGFAGFSFARFRLSSIAGLTFFGPAPDGEVEDYEVYIGDDTPPEEFDWGDAPDMPYPTLAANNGAHHLIVPGVYLGNSVDPEPDGQPNSNATGDDNDGNNDDDGVTFTSPIIVGQTASFDVFAFSSGNLNVWVDFNINGSWADPGEHLFQDVWLNPGLNSFTYIVPQTSVPGISFARFRFSNMPGLSFNGFAPDGEVEDYEIQIVQDVPPDDIDWGDAPDGPYPTLSINNGAHHMIIPGFFLGNSVDPEPDGQPDPTATGDDNDGNNDDDGVIFTSQIIPGQIATVDVIASAPGILNAWIDFDFNGSWAEPFDHFFIDFPLNPGLNNLTFTVPNLGIVGHTFARFRFSNMPGLPWFGFAPDGEVEDYMVYIGTPAGDIQMDPDPMMAFVQNEISMAIVPSPTGGLPTVLLSAYNDHPYPGGPGLGVSYSHDAGTTWVPQQLQYPKNPLGISYADAFDPAATADGLGNLFVAHISTDHDWTNGPESGLYVHKSIDGGITWQAPVQIAYDAKPAGSPDPNYRFNDRCQITCDLNPGSPFYNHLYAVWIKDRGWNMSLPYSDVYFSKSTDGGLTWSPSVTLNQPIHDMGNMPNPAVAPDGSIYVIWIDYNVLTGGLGTIFMNVSNDGGLTWMPSDMLVTVVNLPPLNLNGGTDVLAKGAAVIETSPFNPMELYIVYAEQVIAPPDEADIFFVKSLDGGLSWTIPLRVNDDITLNDQVMPWMDVKPNGIIDIVWYDRRNDPADMLWDVFMATSLNGGNSFLPNQQVNAVPAPSPQTPTGIWMGEYLGLVVDNTHAYIGFASAAWDIQGDVFFAKVENPTFDIDFGDAPDPTYPTLLANDGARHILDGITFLGASVDAEPDGQPDPNALGDDNDGNDDEDGVVFNWPMLVGSPASISVTASSFGLLNAWFDFDGDGTWSQPNEHVFIDLALNAGTHILTCIVPVNAVPGITFARFRFSTQPGLSYTGLASDGEVEDYEVMIEANPDLKWQQLPGTNISGLHAHDYINTFGNHEYIVLADDWLCQGGAVAGIRWWGNYEIDYLGVEKRGAGINFFRLSIHSDDPTGSCLPIDPPIWSMDVPFLSIPELPTGQVNNENCMIYEYTHILSVPFNQIAGTRYWLAITAFSVDPNNNPDWRWQEAHRVMFPILCTSAGKISPLPDTWGPNNWGPPGYLVSDMAFALDPGELMTDFGDAPDPTYPTLLANDGARHIMDGFTYLGASVDPEPDGQPDANATGDDNDGNNDDDGVVLSPFTPVWTPGGSVWLDITATGNGYLSAWVDYNANGSWADPGEQILTDQLMTPGPNSFILTIPNYAEIGRTFARYRFSSVPGLSFTGLAPDGEVEDYQIMMEGDVDVDIKVFLEGAYNGSDMNTDLNDANLLPLTQPYGSDPAAKWYYTGTESVAVIPDPDITDWVLVEFRDAPDASQATGSTRVAQMAAFLKKDGSVVGLDGISPLKVYGVFQYQPYVVVWHRNHLGVLSANPLVKSGVNHYIIRLYYRCRTSLQWFAWTQRHRRRSLRYVQRRWQAGRFD